MTNNYSSPYMPRPSTPTRNFPSQISPTPNRTGNMGRGSASDGRSHGNSRSGRGRLAGGIIVADIVALVRIVV